MPSAKYKHYLHLHILVFIAGFTAILGELISISAIPLVWFRMLMALILIAVFAAYTKAPLRLSKTAVLKLVVAGIIIALHWITFFAAIKASNISIALAMFSTGAFFASLIEPIIYKRRVIWYEILFGIVVIIGVSIITQSEFKYIEGIILGIISAFLSSLFAVLNGKFLERYTATTISFYEFLSGVLFITLVLLISNEGFSKSFFELPISDYSYLFLLASVCTAYAFIASVYIMKYITPYTVVLTYNLEPVYGIILALLLFPKTEKMTASFYFGAILILSVVLLNGIFKHKIKTKTY